MLVLLMEPKNIRLGGYEKSWDHFFDKIFDLRRITESDDGKSFDEFWSFLEFLQKQYRDNLAGIELKKRTCFKKQGLEFIEENWALTKKIIRESHQHSLVNDLKHILLNGCKQKREIEV